ncbi:MAG: hypothetical protein A2700_02470 [Candidatus Blackburnbacteria bacterium RIFCSPHIGHO2_01_FULL_44_64]|uniref:Uncharacterized protein n=1 Tax=Candidatus Blackburnbacteria bacterium RIFCSPHIGHO2_02_FULL_44_20 TaxID=1797516 RepID=A0A1G1V784_9BACT|nr:MAG: hypothetical protein A2700_02470 [Candidatus Blackburnbacteria bacterium RIFCSPHIGHO2_01_FULL_44_64]OGY11318.1 MAG: hypothetical protein A3D26_02325 [Candidatus Blackburnbacteria bacterium RIFCSPHIGHO2_02_FULL_44_20]OGY11455.1 MAG: hypothetical protein A3E16_02220 [Candidatus Blackburnbacteria bacterium RIFCSPHIGHO2_12_FULL_44_25]OGY14378.1 MAG: hypothetical protein A3A62_01790 [Candidatus Blackburnbacteria bacterium RIFCSPLOWO2_01_FULL_44_43]OGY17359.1 MAG: hypothetical protein A3H88_0
MMSEGQRPVVDPNFADMDPFWGEPPPDPYVCVVCSQDLRPVRALAQQDRLAGSLAGAVASDGEEIRLRVEECAGCRLAYNTANSS